MEMNFTCLPIFLPIINLYFLFQINNFIHKHHIISEFYGRIQNRRFTALQKAISNIL